MVKLAVCSTSSSWALRLIAILSLCVSEVSFSSLGWTLVPKILTRFPLEEFPAILENFLGGLTKKLIIRS